MIDLKLRKELGSCFKKGYFNVNDEFIIRDKGNVWIPTYNANTRKDLEVAIIEYVSRACCDSMVYKSKYYNDKYHNEILSEVNMYLGTNFTIGDMSNIYWILGNGVRHKKTIEFVENGYDLDKVLRPLIEK